MMRETRRTSKIVWLMSAAALMAMMTQSAKADVVLNVDLSVLNTVTVSATPGLSAATVSGSTVTGFYLDAIFGSGPNPISGVGGGNLTTANDPSDGTPNIFRSGNSDFGLNFWSYSTNATSSFTAGSVAFAGSGTWTIDPGAYTDLLNGASSGDVYFPADDITDLPTASLIGTYRVTTGVPEPSTIGLVSLVAVGLVYRRRRA